MQRTFLILGLIILSVRVNSQQVTAGHSIAKEEVLRSIPVEYVHQARNNLVIAYQHTSHGTHVARGVFGLQDYKPGDDTLFAVSSNAEPGKLDFRDYALQDYAPAGVDASDLSADETAFIQTTRNYLDDPANAEVNVVMWSWCDIAGHHPETNYLPGMDSLIAEYGAGGSRVGSGPGQREQAVDFIFMTGHANANANTGDRNPKNQSALIIEHCEENGYFCLDYYSIDTHDMDDNYWEDTGDNGDSEAYGGNFYEDWQNAHVLGTDYFENKMWPGGDPNTGAHNTQHITANRKGYAMWWILARIAGWENEPSPVPVSQIIVVPEGGATGMLTGDSLLFSAQVLPAGATDKTVVWSLLEGTGSGSISEQGMVVAAGAGTVTVVATAADGSGVKGMMNINIADPLVPVDSITITAAGGGFVLETGGTLQLVATVHPGGATSQEITWAVIHQTGSGSISGDGLFTGTGEGTVLVVAQAEDGSGVSDTCQLTIEDGSVDIRPDDPREFLLYPNPSNGLVHVQAYPLSTLKLVEVVAMNGETILQVRPGNGTSGNDPAGNRTAGPGTDEFHLDLSGADPGLYLVRFQTRTSRILKKVLITK